MQGGVNPACHHRISFLHSLQEGNLILEAPATSPRLSGLHSFQHSHCIGFMAKKAADAAFFVDTGMFGVRHSGEGRNDGAG